MYVNVHKYDLKLNLQIYVYIYNHNRTSIQIETTQESRRQILHHLVQFDELSSSLCSAAQHGELATVTTLLRRGAPVHGLDAAGYTPLHYACSIGAYDCVKLLLEFGSDCSSNISGYVCICMYMYLYVDL